MLNRRRLKALSDVGGAVLIVGASSGIGRELAYELGAHKKDIILASRDAGELQTIAADIRIRFGATCQVCAMDLTDVESHSSRISDCMQSAGPSGLAGIVVCSGFSGEQKHAEIAWTETRQILESNFVGVVSLLNQLAGYFEERRKGFICVVTSVAGDRGRQSNYIYGAAKAGMAVYLQGLGNRLHAANVSVTTIKPGYVDTPMTFGKPGAFLVANPDSVARSILDAIADRRYVSYVPWFWRWIMLIIRSVPEPAFKRMKL